jgi:hypothetical protein
MTLNDRPSFESVLFTQDQYVFERGLVFKCHMMICLEFQLAPLHYGELTRLMFETLQQMAREDYVRDFAFTNTDAVVDSYGEGVTATY